MLRLTPQFPSPVIKFSVDVMERSDGRYRFAHLPGGAYTAELLVPAHSQYQYQRVSQETIQVTGDLAHDFVLPR